MSLRGFVSTSSSNVNRNCFWNKEEEEEEDKIRQRKLTNDRRNARVSSLTCFWLNENNHHEVEEEGSWTEEMPQVVSIINFSYKTLAIQSSRFCWSQLEKKKGKKIMSKYFRLLSCHFSWRIKKEGEEEKERPRVKSSGQVSRRRRVKDLSVYALRLQRHDTPTSPSSSTRWGKSENTTTRRSA